ncbi:ATP synthase F1 subunit epsilon [candidate division KSB1 bacterium]|nr:ATP synthase F1 subunit epsilon [candidate division KSB1 bacterium]
MKTAKEFTLEIITPSRIIYTAAVTYVRVPAICGYLGILYGHAPLITALTVGEIRVRLGTGNMKFFSVSGGMLEILANTVTVLAETAEEAEMIDLDRALRSKDRARDRMRQKVPDIDIDRARRSLMKALNRIKVKQHSD